MAASRTPGVSRRLAAGVTALALVGAGLGFTTAAYADDDPTAVVIDFSQDGYDPDAPNAPKDQNGWTAGATGDWGIEAADNALRYSSSVYAGGAISYLFSPRTANAGEPDGGGEYNTFSGEFVLAPVDDEYQEGLNVQVAFDDGNADRNGGALNFRHVDGRLAVTAFWPTIDAELENWRNETVWFDDPTESHVVRYQVQYIPGAQDTLTVWIDGEEVFTVPTWETYSGTKYSTNSLLFRPASSTFTEDGIGFDTFSITPEEGEALAGKGFLFSDIAYEVWDTAITTVDPATLEVGGNKVGDLLEIQPGEYTPLSDAYELSAEWHRDGELIAGADDLQYTISGADLGAELTAKIVVALPGYATVTYTLEGSVEVEGISTVSVTADRVDGTQAGGRWFEDQFTGDGGFFDHPRTPDSGVSGFTQWANGPWTPPAQIPNKIFRLDTIDPSYQQGTWSVGDDGFTLDVNTADATYGKLRFIAYVGQTGVESIDRHLGITLSDLLNYPLSWDQQSTSGLAGPILNIFLTKEIEEGRWITTTVGTQAQGTNGVLDFSAIGKWNSRTNAYSNGLFDGTLVSPYNHFSNPDFTTAVLESNFGDFSVVGFGINLGADNDYAWTIQDINILGNLIHFSDQSTFTKLTDPVITGSVQEGGTVGVDVPTFTPSDVEGTEVTYTWQLGSDTPVEGNTYEIPSDAKGQELTVTATVSAPGYADLVVESEPVTVLGTFTAVAAPVISGDVAEGETVTAEAPEFTPADVEDTEVTYTWQLGTDTPVPGPEYEIPSDSRGQFLKLWATVSAPGYADLVLEADSERVLGVFAEVTAPVITGTPKVGATLTATGFEYEPDVEGATVSYAWILDGADAVFGPEFVVPVDSEGLVLELVAFVDAPDFVVGEFEAEPVLILSTFTAEAPPGISGTVAVGNTVSATPPAYLPDLEDATISYFWQVGEGDLYEGDDFEIGAGAAGLPLTLAAIVSAPGYEDLVIEAEPVTVAKGTLVASKPGIGGAVKVDQAVSVVAPVVEGDVEDVSIAYEWLVGGSLVSSANSYKLPASASGKSLVLRAVITAAGYDDLTVDSVSKTVAAGTFTSTPAPTVKGTKAVGQTLEAVPGTWTPSASLKYQWYLGSAKIAGATSSKYTVKVSDLGKSILVEVTGSKTGYTAKSVKSKAGTVVAGAFTTAPTPTITGTTKVGSTLTANAGTWKPTATLKYQWYRGTAAIKGATGKTYKLDPADFGKSITVKVTGSATGYTAKTVTSGAKKITAGTLTAATPTITGTLKAGSTLTAKPGTWKAGTSTKVAFKYQWLVAGKAVSGATKSTFKVPTSAKGKTVSVKVTGSATGYTTLSKTSATKKIAK